MRGMAVSQENELKFKPADKTKSMQNGLIIGNSMLHQNLQQATQHALRQSLNVRPHHNGLVTKREKKSSTSEDQMIIEVEH